MEGFGASTFGELYADGYDVWNDPGTTEQAVEFLTQLAGNSSTLELSIGTGRVALPLLERGVPIQGIEAWKDMVTKLREKSGGDVIPVAIADMSDFSLDESFDLVFLIFNTLFNLQSQQTQIDCLSISASTSPRNERNSGRCRCVMPGRRKSI